jgi:hypothetical protein
MLSIYEKETLHVRRSILPPSSVANAVEMDFGASKDLRLDGFSTANTPCPAHLGADAGRDTASCDTFRPASQPTQYRSITVIHQA